MLRINQIKVYPNATKEDIKKKTSAVLKIRPKDIKSIEIIKQSIDARKKPEIYYSYTVDVELTEELLACEAKIISSCKSNQISKVENKPYSFPKNGNKALEHPPVIVGMGPAGLFCAYFLAKHGYCPIVIERGKNVDERTADVKYFWETGILNKESNVQFGEGGAGTFSDGKLNTLIKDKDGRNREVLKVFVKHGAPDKILYDYKPHIGTDILTEVVKDMRREIISNGGQVLFETKLERLLIENNCIKSIIVKNNKGEFIQMNTEHLILAIGHSARDTFETLFKQNVPMEAKSFAVGFRVEHPQSMINEIMYGNEDVGILGAAPYKVTAKTSVNRGVYSFCMCPGGYVVNASSEEKRLAVNGMSYSDRGSANANSAIIVSVTPDDFGSDHPLAGIEFQRKLEEKAYEAGNGRIPVQLYGEFKDIVEQTIDKETVNVTYAPCIKGSYCFSDLTKILPKECNKAFVEGMESFATQIKGFNRADTILSGIESRTSSPVRISRGENLQSEIKGLYPCGEGAGYAGGITSAAMDGIRVAEEIAKEYKSIS